MKKMVTIVDYGSGNIRSVEKAIQRLGWNTLITDSSTQIVESEAIIFPGQGNSESAMVRLNERDLVNPLREVIGRGTPFFGVCLGMQVLLDSSEEGPTPCLGITKGKVVLLPPEVKRPHMGWNRVNLKGEHPVFHGVDSGSYFYFVHSYYAVPDDHNVVAGHTTYGVRFCSAVAWGNATAVQFHPEKSGVMGLKIYKNFIKLVREFKCE